MRILIDQAENTGVLKVTTPQGPAPGSGAA
jgi:hypothetical protein